MLAQLAFTLVLPASGSVFWASDSRPAVPSASSTPLNSHSCLQTRACLRVGEAGRAAPQWLPIVAVVLVELLSPVHGELKAG